ncbi:MAG: hypothetical protein NVSMB38_09020 [Ktedonobacteraceae bacterium]
MGIPPTGKQITVTAMSIFRIANGRAVEQGIITDGLVLRIASLRAKLLVDLFYRNS